MGADCRSADGTCGFNTFMDLLSVEEIVVGICAALLLGVALAVIFVPPRFVVGEFLKDIDEQARYLLASRAPEPEALDRMIDQLDRLSPVMWTRELRHKLIEKQVRLSGA